MYAPVPTSSPTGLYGTICPSLSNFILAVTKPGAIPDAILPVTLISVIIAFDLIDKEKSVSTPIVLVSLNVSFVILFTLD